MNIIIIQKVDTLSLYREFLMQPMSAVWPYNYDTAMVSFRDPVCQGSQMLSESKVVYHSEPVLIIMVLINLKVEIFCAFIVELHDKKNEKCDHIIDIAHYHNKNMMFFSRKSCLRSKETFQKFHELFTRRIPLRWMTHCAAFDRNP